MALYTIEVIETRTYDCLYTVEADSPEEAEAKASIGDTVDEEDAKFMNVIDRNLSSDPRKIDDQS